MADRRLDGASDWEQLLYDRLMQHLDDESDVLQAYEELAASTDAPSFRYLARLILDDERRHHLLLRDLAETIRVTVEMTGEEPPIPELASHRWDRPRVLAETERFLKLESSDDDDLVALAEELRPLERQTLWQLIIKIMRYDGMKHRAILEFVRDRASAHS